MTASYALYGGIFLVWAVFEILGFARGRVRVPWVTTSETVWALEKRLPWLRIVVALGLGLLTVHLAAPHWP